MIQAAEMIIAGLRDAAAMAEFLANLDIPRGSRVQPTDDGADITLPDGRTIRVARSIHITREAT
jgi:hypothetical protein